jgi:hypothetical protein
MWSNRQIIKEFLHRSIELVELVVVYLECAILIWGCAIQTFVMMKLDARDERL